MMVDRKEGGGGGKGKGGGDQGGGGGGEGGGEGGGGEGGGSKWIESSPVVHSLTCLCLNSCMSSVTHLNTS